MLRRAFHDLLTYSHVTTHKDGASKIKEKVKSSGVKSLTGKDIVKEVILLSKKTSNTDSKKLHKSINEVIQNKEYEWKTANVLEGNIEFE